MSQTYHTIRELLVAAEQNFGAQDAFRYKVKDNGDGGKKEVKIEAKTYTQFKKDSEYFSAVLASLGEQGKHIAVIGPTSIRGWLRISVSWTAGVWRFRSMRICRTKICVNCLTARM